MLRVGAVSGCWQHSHASLLSSAFNIDLWPAYCSRNLAWSRYLVVLSALQLSVAIAYYDSWSTRASAYFDLARAVSLDPTVLNLDAIRPYNWGERERAPSCGLNGRAVTIDIYIYIYISLGSRPPPFRARFNYA